MSATAAGDTRGELDRFRTLVLEDSSLQESLASIEDAAAFAEHVIAAAARRSIRLVADDLKSFVQNDPIGLSRLTMVPLPAPPTPQKGWLPIQLSRAMDRFFVDWAYFGNRRLAESFFEDSIRRALRLPFNRMFRFRTPLSELVRWSERLSDLRPSGFIFHMSRCGSTLVAQMLAASVKNVVVSEAAPIDGAVQLARALPDMPEDERVALLRSMVAAFGQRRSGEETRYFVKLDAWHAMALPLFRKAFPDVPWVFLYRDPVEVMVSQTRETGTQMIPGIIPPSLYGLDAPDNFAGQDYRARVLARICEAALHEGASGGGLFVDYRELPDALCTSILPHFGVEFSPAECEFALEAARYHAKRPHAEFVADGKAKQSEATDALREAVDEHLAGIHRRLVACNSGRSGRTS